MVSSLIITPGVLIWSTKPLPRLRAARVFEALLVLSVLVLVAQIVFQEWWTPFAVRYQLKYLTLLPLLWVAFRFKQHGASLASIVVSAIALAGALRQVGGAG